MAPPDLLTARLDALRSVGDPPADRAVAALGRHVWAANVLLREVHRNVQPLPAGVPEVLRPFVPAELPAWADTSRIAAAQRFAERHLPLVTVSLFCASLPASYAAADGAAVLHATGRMRRDLDQRVNETASFVLEVLRPHGFEPEGRARIAIGKVRIVHAGVRASLDMKSPTGDVPINQEDLLGTMGLFSLAVTDSLERLGVRAHPRDTADFLHLWCVVGAMLGIREDLLPRDVAGARALFETIRRRQVRQSEHGRALMRELLEGMERHVRVPGLVSAPGHLVHYLLGADLATQLGVPAPAPSWRRRIERGRRVLGRAPGTELLSALVGRRLLEAIVAAKLGGRAASYGVPGGISRTAGTIGPSRSAAPPDGSRAGVAGAARDRSGGAGSRSA